MYISLNKDVSVLAYTAAAALNADVVGDVVVSNVWHHSNQVGRVVGSTT